MNCKQGDLARIVPCVMADEWARGLIVRCVSASTSPDGDAGWDVEPQLRHPMGRCFTSVADTILRPICDPGEDARDETLAWRPLPLVTEEV